VLDAIGYVGGILLGLCAVPEVYRSYKTGQCHVGHGFLWMWFLGEICLFAYVLPKADIPLIGNYLFNIVLISIMMFYKYRGKREL